MTPSSRSITIIGRPNVGKSTLFNRIVGSRVAVVDDEAGITRDCHYQESSWAGTPFLLCDTGGLVPTEKQGMAATINARVDRACDESNLIVFLVDGRTGATDLDLLIARSLRARTSPPVIVAANKCETEESRQALHQFLTLGLGDALPVSALVGTGVGDLLDAAVKALPSTPARAASAASGALRIAVVGRPNAGKSSLVNRLLGSARMIVDSVPGTTRDAVDSPLRLQGRDLVLIDTAGMRKKSRVRKDVEYYANLRALNAVSRSQVCILLIDAADGLREQDQKIITQIIKARRGLVVGLNKWDLVSAETRTFDTVVAQVRRQVRELRYVPFVSLSALTGRRVETLLLKACEVGACMDKRVPAARFEEQLFAWVAANPHPTVSGKDVRILGGRQIPAAFPHFRIVAANHVLVTAAYTRYLTNKIQTHFDFSGCPVVLRYTPPARGKRR